VEVDALLQVVQFVKVIHPLFVYVLKHHIFCWHNYKKGVYFLCRVDLYWFPIELFEVYHYFNKVENAT
jgi:hypothetical protein